MSGFRGLIMLVTCSPFSNRVSEEKKFLEGYFFFGLCAGQLNDVKVRWGWVALVSWALVR